MSAPTAASVRVAPEIEPSLTVGGQPPPSFRSDASVMGLAMAVATLLGVAQVIVLPKLLSVQTFGEYRIFLLYGSYVGLLHLGFADGALIRWAAGGEARILAEWRRIAPRILGLQLAALVMASIVSVMLPRTHAMIVRSVFALAVAMNMLTLAQFALQASRRFWVLAATTIGPPLIFLASLFLLPSDVRTTAVIAGAYVLAQLCACLLAVSALLTSRARSEGATATFATPLRATTLFRVGSSVLLANLAAGLTQSLDRLMLSWKVPAAIFAQYAFAASALSIATTTALGISRTALPHAASREGRVRGEFLDRLQAFLLVAYGAGLSLVPGFEWLVRHWLPAYADSLVVFRILLVGALFWTATQVILVVALQAAGSVHTQLQMALFGTAAVAVGAGAAAFSTRSLPIVAAGASAAMLVTWIAGFWRTRQVLRESGPTGPLRFLTTAGAQSTSMLVVAYSTRGVLTATLLYVVLAAIPTLVAARALIGSRRGAR